MTEHNDLIASRDEDYVLSEPEEPIASDGSFVMTQREQLIASRSKDFSWCETIIKKNSKSFYTAFSRLPDDKAKSIFAIYAFCRMADDSVDFYKSEKQLGDLEDKLTQFFSGNIPDEPLWRALEIVFSIFELPQEPFFDLLHGQRMDLNFQQPKTQDEMETYSYYVAGSVGLMILPILTDQPENLQREAVGLGVAMQITNILRDIGEDLCAGRVYLPAEEMKSFGVSKKSLEQHTINADFIELWEKEAARAEKLYNLFEEKANLLNEDSRLPVLIALYFYRGILDAVREVDYDCFSERNYVSDEQKRKLLITLKEKETPMLEGSR